MEIIFVSIGCDNKFELTCYALWEDDYKIQFSAVVAEVFVDPKNDVFLVFGGFVDEVFDGMIVVLEPVPEGVDFFHCVKRLFG
jgi:hypothetical protein